MSGPLLARSYASGSRARLQEGCVSDGNGDDGEDYGDDGEDNGDDGEDDGDDGEDDDDNNIKDNDDDDNKSCGELHLLRRQH